MQTTTSKANVHNDIMVRGSVTVLRELNVKIHSRHVITDRKRSLGQGNIFTTVCHSVHSGRGWLPSMHHRSHDQGEGLHQGGSVSMRGGWQTPSTTVYGQ